jgi:nucleoside-diphosphate-sugar epimerase
VRALVSGASGFLGAELLRSTPPDLELIGLTRGHPRPDTAGVAWVTVDVAQPGFQRSLPGQVDAVVQLAQSRHDRDLPEHVDDLVDVNVGATARLLDYARTAGARRFVLASTATVYRPSSEPLSETDPLTTGSLYAASKLAAELLCEAFSEIIPCTALRLFTTYGAAQRGRLVADLIARVREGGHITVQGKRGLLLSPIHVSDVAAAVHAAIGRTTPGFELVNVGGAERLGVKDIAETIGAAVGRAPELAFVDGPEPGGYVADLTRLRQLFDLPEPLPFAAGLELTLQHEPTPP